MGSNTILLIRQSIKAAQETESRTRSLQNHVNGALSSLHNTITLPHARKTQVFYEFLLRYIDKVPSFLEALTEITSDGGIHELLEPILNIVEGYFLSPPSDIEKHEGLLALLDEAYLAHRLMEELNDRIMAICGVPLIPMDMTISNIVVHDFIGEEFANKLDLAVHYSVQALFVEQGVAQDTKFIAFVEYLSTTKRDNIVERWPCLAEDSAVSLELELKQTPVIIH